MKKQNIPVGISAFSEIRRNGYYYVDKRRSDLRASGNGGGKGHADYPPQKIWQNRLR